VGTTYVTIPDNTCYNYAHKWHANTKVDGMITNRLKNAPKIANNSNKEKKIKYHNNNDNSFALNMPFAPQNSEYFNVLYQINATVNLLKTVMS